MELINLVHYKGCQCCGHNRPEPVLSLGYMPLVNQSINKNTKADGYNPQFELALNFCNNCGLTQLRSAPVPQQVFPPEYPYTSGMTQALKDNFADLCREVGELLSHTTPGFVVDIGSNDGTLLSYFKNDGYAVLGIEPTNTAQIARAAGIPTEQQFFNAEIAKYIARAHGRADIITCANCFAHMDDLNSVMLGIKELLTPTGVFVSESHYLIDLIRDRQYDTIYHEHLRYYSIRALQYLFGMHQMEIFHITKIPTHGGSIRVYAAQKGLNPVDNSVAKALSEELDLPYQKTLLKNLGDVEIPQSKLRFYRLLHALGGERVVGIGAPSRATTLINYLGLDVDIVNYVCELDGSLKIGTEVPGTRIPIVSERRLFDEQPDVAIIFSWHIADDIASNLRKKGYKGTLVTPLPIPRVISP